jgi:hypothetical protein
MESVIKGVIVEVYHEGKLVPGLSLKDFSINETTVVATEEIEHGKYFLTTESVRMKVIKGGAIPAQKVVAIQPHGPIKRFFSSLFQK